VRRTAGGRATPTLPDVAQAAGVSTATAARALGGYGSVREETRQRVQAAAAELGYRANSLARSLITGSTNTIGVVLADIENSFFARALRGIADTAHTEGFEVVLVNSDEDLGNERNAVRVLTEKRVDGLVVCPADARDTSCAVSSMPASRWSCWIAVFPGWPPTWSASTITPRPGRRPRTCWPPGTSGSAC
jgi:LacI family transcriptional regulator